MKKIAICGGHLTPALALIEELKKQNDIEIVFFGRKFATEGSRNLSAEYTTVTKLGIKFYPITAGRLQRKLTRYTLIALLKTPIGFVQSLYYLVKTKPSAIVSFGGYLSTPVVFAGWLLGIKSLTHEQSPILGLANKINANFTKKVYLSWERTAEAKKGAKYKVIGNLVRKSAFNKNAKDEKIAEFLKTEKKLIFITGGNQGSHFINSLIFEALSKLTNFQILHQVGTANHKGDLDLAKKISTQNYMAVDYLSGEDMGAVLNRADLVISRSGANTVWDLAILAKVAILIPLPISAGGEQEANARILEKAGSAVVANEDDLTPDILIKKISHIYNNYSKFQKAAQTFAKTLSNDAVKTFSAEILEIIKG